MSEFIADARVLIRPDTTGFRAQLQEQVNRAIAQAQTQLLPLQIPISLGGTALGAATTATSRLVAEQKLAVASTLGLADAAQVENTAFGRQATILEVASAATLEKAGADRAAATAATHHAAAQSQATKGAIASLASFTGLRGAVLAAGTTFLGATIAVQAFGKAISSTVDLETQLNVFRVTSGATADEMERVAAQARALGQDITLPAVSAGDAAQAFTELSKAGLSVQDSLAGARGVLQLATAAQIDNVAATELVANSLNAFALNGEEAVRVADLLTGAANEAQGSIADMGIALKQSAAVASLVGFSIEDTVLVLTQLAQAGLSSSDAGTSFRTALIRLINPTVAVQGALNRLNVDLRDAQGNLRPEIFTEIGEALAGMNPAVRQATIAILGGSDAVRAFGLLSRETAESTQATREAITESGLAAELAGARTEGLAGQMEGLKNEADALGITLGQLATPILSSLAGGLSTTFRGVNLAVEGIRSLVAPPREAAQSIGDLNDRLREAQRELERYETGAFADAAATEGMRKRVQEASAAFRQLGFSALEAGRGISGFDVVARGVTNTINDLITALEKVRAGAVAGQAADSGLNVQQVLNRITGFDSAETRARIRGNTQEILGLLREEQAFLEGQLERDFVKRRPALQRQLENALFGVTNDIAAIAASGASDAKSAAADAARAIQDADAALLDALGQRRDDAQRKITAAADTTSLQDDIKAQDRFQALIKIQIAKIRARIKDEQARKEAIRALRIALIQSRAEEEALRQQQREAAAARQDEIQNLNIAIAEARGNDAAIEAAIQARIKTLNKQIKAAKGDRLKVKQLILERERLKQQLRELREKEDEAKEEGKSAAATFFEFLQAQQGFASNLLGNLIPLGQTAGLVGQPSPAAPGASVAREAGLSASKERMGSTSGQFNQLLSLEEQMLRVLVRIANGEGFPEAKYQRSAGSAVMDIQ